MLAAMAIYAFECKACGEQWEQNADMKDGPRLTKKPPACPKCGQKDTKRLVTGFSMKPDWRIY